MNIDRIKNLGSNSDVKKASPLKSDSSISGNDKISISSEAKELSEEYKLISDVKQIALSALSSAEDSVRIQKLNQVRAKLSRGEYEEIPMEIIEKTADNFLNSLLEK